MKTSIIIRRGSNSPSWARARVWKATCCLLAGARLTVWSSSPDTIKPTLTISTPTANQRVLINGGQWLVKGTARDNVGVGGVRVNPNNQGWQAATGTTAWQASISLAPGANTVTAYAVDAAGNKSATNKVTFTWVVTAPLTVRTNGAGKVSPNYNGQQLELGKGYRLAATAANGWVFTNWTSNLLPPTTKAALSFVMQANLTLTANFLQRPVIATPPANQTVSQHDTATFTVSVRGSEPLSYQWLRNGIALPGATQSTLQITDAKGTDAGTYQVVVRNPVGSVNSAVAILTVTNPYVGRWESNVSINGNSSLKDLPLRVYLSIDIDSKGGFRGTYRRYRYQRTQCITAGYLQVCVDWYTMDSGWSGQVSGHMDLDTLSGTISFPADGVNTTFTSSTTSGSGVKLIFASSYPSNSRIYKKSAAAMIATADLPDMGRTGIEDQIPVVRGVPCLALAYRPAEAEMDVTIYSEDEAPVRLEYSTDLREWLPLGTWTGSRDGVRITDTGVTEQAMRFYRAVRLDATSAPETSTTR